MRISKIFLTPTQLALSRLATHPAARIRALTSSFITIAYYTKNPPACVRNPRPFAIRLFENSKVIHAACSSSHASLCPWDENPSPITLCALAARNPRFLICSPITLSTNALLPNTTPAPICTTLLLLILCSTSSLGTHPILLGTDPNFVLGTDPNFANFVAISLIDSAFCEL